MQVKNAFDVETIAKIIKGAFIAGGGVAVVYILNAIAVLDYGQYSALIAGICAVLINFIREWHKGVDEE